MNVLDPRWEALQKASRFPPQSTLAHAALSASAIAILKQSLPAGCQVFSSDLKVRIEASDLSTFPDVTVVSGTPQTSALDAQAVINPQLLVEITSRSTEDYDRGDKLSHYKQLPSLRAVLFVSHRTRSISVVRRTTTGWEQRDCRPGETVSLDEPTFSFAVDALYSGIDLDAK